MNYNRKKLIILSCLISSILILSTFTSISVLGYDWNTTQTYTLQEEDNIGYGVLDGQRIRENQYLEAEYDTDIRYVHLDSQSVTENMANDSTDFRISTDSILYNSYRRFDLDSAEWKQLPTYFQAFNNTGVGPNLQITTGINNQGYLSLNSKTALELYPDILYVFKVSLVAGKMFDLNFKTTAGMDYLIFLDDVLSNSGSVNGLTRDIQPLVARAKGDYFIYLLSNSYNYIIIQPQEIDVNNLSANQLAAGYFVNEPNNIWNETKQTFEENQNKETIHAYYLNLNKGTYLFKYIKFDNYDTEAYISPSVKWQTLSSVPSYYDRTIDTDPTNKRLYHFEYDTTVVVYIEAERDGMSWIEFDYFFSVEELDTPPILQPEDQYDYDDSFFYYGIEIEETQAVYFNMTGMSPFNVWYFKHLDAENVFRGTYSLQADSMAATKIILEPGYYFFMNQNEGTYDLTIEFNTVSSETYLGGSLDFSISQRNGDSSNYKLIKIENSNFGYHNYNISLVTQNNYTAEVGYYIFKDSFDLNRQGYVFFRLGTQQVLGTYQPYGETDTQMLNILSPGEITTYYLLIDLLALYNNTGYAYPSYGVFYSEPVTVTLRFKEDSNVPEPFDSVNINYINATLNEDGSGYLSRTFDTAINDYDLYIIQVTVPDYTWYNLKIVIINGTRDSITYNLHNYDGVRDYRFRRHSVWNKYYCLDPFSATQFVTYDDSNISHVTFEVEFGVFDPNLIFMFSVDHSGLNGSISFEFVPHDSTLVSPADPGRFLGGGLGLIGSIILGIVGGALAVAAIVILVVKVIIPKSKGSSSPSSPQY